MTMNAMKQAVHGFNTMGTLEPKSINWDYLETNAE